MSYLHWKKGERKQLSPHFYSHEFSCRCKYPTCVAQQVSQELIDSLEKLRVALDSPITVTSGYRCKQQQEYLRRNLPAGHTASGTSTHETGDAADITSDDVGALALAAANQFMAIGTASSFIHVDTRKGKVRRWKYV